MKKNFMYFDAFGQIKHYQAHKLNSPVVDTACMGESSPLSKVDEYWGHDARPRTCQCRFLANSDQQTSGTGKRTP